MEGRAYTVTVRRGETLYQIAKRLGVTVRDAFLPGGGVQSGAAARRAARRRGSTADLEPQGLGRCRICTLSW